MRFDAVMEQRQEAGAGPQRYAALVAALAEARFDVWARRGLSAVSGGDDAGQYTRWLEAYRENWLRYVRETCPKVDVHDLLGDRLGRRVQHWTSEASKCYKAESSPRHG
jgi:hypothetical protein